MGDTSYALMTSSQGPGAFECKQPLQDKVQDTDPDHYPRADRPPPSCPGAEAPTLCPGHMVVWEPWPQEGVQGCGGQGGRQQDVFSLGSQQGACPPGNNGGMLTPHWGGLPVTVGDSHPRS